MTIERVVPYRKDASTVLRWQRQRPRHKMRDVLEHPTPSVAHLPCPVGSAGFSHDFLHDTEEGGENLARHLVTFVRDHLGANEMIRVAAFAHEIEDSFEDTHEH